MMRITASLAGLTLLAGCAHRVIAPPPPLFVIATGNPGIPLCGSSPPPCLESYTVDGNGRIINLAITVATWQATQAGTYSFTVNMIAASGKRIASPPAVAR